MKLHDYQQEALEWHKQKKYSVNAFTMGLGKSVVALGLHRDVSKKTLVVCPKFLIENWRDEIEKFGATGYIQCTNYAKITAAKLDDFDLVIIDEAHYLKNPIAKRSRNLYTAISKNPPEYLLMLTATPCKNNVAEIFNLIRFCTIVKKDKYFSRFRDNYIRFQSKFMEVYIMKMGGRSIRQYKGFKNRADFKDLYTRHVYRKKLKQVYLPPVVDTYLNAGDFRLEKELEDLCNVFDKEHFMTVKAKAALHLADFTIEFLSDFDKQAVIFTDHVKSAAKLAEKLGVPMVTGMMTVKDRQVVIEDFKANRVKFLVATYKCAGVGLSLTNCNYMIINDLPFVPADLEQAKGRIRRVTQEKTCFYYYIGLSKMYFRLFNILKKKSDLLEVAID